MRQKPFGAVLDISSEKLSLIVLSKSDNMDRVFCVAKSYNAYVDGQLVHYDVLSDNVSAIINMAIEQGFAPLDIIIGLGADLTTVVTKKINKKLDKSQPITEDILEEILKSGNVYDNDTVYYPLNAAPIAYYLDNKKVFNPLGAKASILSCIISYTLAKRNVIEVLEIIQNDLAINIEYVSTLSTLAMYLIDSEQRDQGVYIADINYNNLSVAYVQGDGIIGIATYPAGTDLVAQNLHCTLDMPIPVALRMLQDVNLMIEPHPNDTYDISIKDKKFSYNIAEVNDAVLEAITAIIECIEFGIDAISKINKKIYITGDKIAGLNGIIECIKVKLSDYDVELVSPDILGFNQTEASGLASLLVLRRQLRLKKKNIFKKIQKFLGGKYAK